MIALNTNLKPARLGREEDAATAVNTMVISRKSTVNRARLLGRDLAGVVD
jgi:hypothetical protein